VSDFISSWSADETDFTADFTGALADGSLTSPPTSLKYASLITSQHNQKPNFMALVNAITAGIGDVTRSIQSMQTAFDLDTAVGKQQDIVGQWVGQNRVVADVILPTFFGFGDDASALTFGELGDTSIGGVFYELGETFQVTTTLSDTDYRTILRARIVRNQSNGSLAALENALFYIFGVPANLTLQITVGAPITPVQRALLTSLDILPRPSGVGITSITYSAN
jgi:hypothetical protein